ncbi:MAG: hypothetical protein JOY78_06540, partial [Pseudonocardia sp.]|nr:hypothetical protein [Pseudonocardia sp.]
QLVGHFSPLGVKTYEVWNEPNQSFWWAPKPSPARYAEMVTKADTQAHLADPSVTVLAGVFAPAADNESGTTISPATFLAGMYRAGATFDALSFHPYTQELTDPRVNVAWNMITSIGPALHTIMLANGDGAKKIWATEYTYFTGSARKAVSESEQARFMPLGVEAWRHQSWAGPLIFFTYRDMTANRGELFDNGGLVHRDFSPKPALSALRSYLTD